MNEEAIVIKNETDEFYTYEGSFVYKGRLINLFCDDYGQSFFIQYVEDGKLVEEGCGSYVDWEGYVKWRFRNDESKAD